MQPEPHRLRPALAALLCALLAGATAAAADQWMVYIGGGVQEIAEEGWSERRGQVLFTQLGGTLVSVPYHDVDLPTAAFITWQLGGRRRLPPRVALPATAPPDGEEAPESRPCTAARAVGMRGAETLEVVTADGRETIHVACLDTPESRHPEPQLAWFGRAALGWAEAELRRDAAICLGEQSPPQRDGEGHRIVYVTLADGRDYTAAAIDAGLGLLRPGPCRRAAEYRSLENEAISRGRGLWGPRAERPALQATVHTGGGSSGGLPPRRVGGG